jgi:hypothetical protein
LHVTVEVFEKVAQQRGEGAAPQYVAVMQQGVPLDASLAESLYARHKLPLADSIIYATAQQGNAWFGRRMLTLRAWMASGILRRIDSAERV